MNPTVFPDNIDGRTYFNDLTLAHADTYHGFVERVQAENYQEASAYLNDHADGMDYFGADLFNEIDDRLRKIEVFATSDTRTTNTHAAYGSSEPTDTIEGMIWVV